MKRSNWRDWFFDKDDFELQAATICFLKLERQKLDDFLTERWCECDGDRFKLETLYGWACDESDRLDKRITAECERLRKLLLRP